MQRSRPGLVDNIWVSPVLDKQTNHTRICVVVKWRTTFVILRIYIGAVLQEEFSEFYRFIPNCDM